jgi:hypothetical protein
MLREHASLSADGAKDPRSLSRGADEIRREIAEVEAARADALDPPFHHPPRLDDVRDYDGQLAHLHAEHDLVDLRDVDDPHARIRDRVSSRCPIEQLRDQHADRDGDESVAIRAWLAKWDAAIQRGEITHLCIDSDNATARGKSRPDRSGSERPRAFASAGAGDRKGEAI